MYEEFRISNFRNFSTLYIKDLANINLIAGRNNVGKTALLEALFVHAGMRNPELLWRINSFRGLGLVVDLSPNSAPPWDNAFHNFNLAKEIALSAVINNLGRKLEITIAVSQSHADIDSSIKSVFDQSDKHHANSANSTYGTHVAPNDIVSYRPRMSLQLRTVFKDVNSNDTQSSKYSLLVDSSGIRVEPQPPQPDFVAIFLGPRVRSPHDAERYTKLAVDGQQEILLNALKIIEPRLEKIELLQFGGNPTLFGKLAGIQKLVPLPLMGEGISHIASMVLSMSAARNGIVLIDEIESGIHYSVLESFWSAVANISSIFNVQVFATTHSLECIQSASKVFSGLEDKRAFALYRLERVAYKDALPEQVRAVRFGVEELHTALEHGWEVR